MTPEQWDQVLWFFNLSVEESAVNRRALLAEVDPAVRQEVERLLQAYDDDPCYLEAPLARLPDVLPAWGLSGPAAPSREGERVGPYRLLRRLGAGGMGAVYLARRDDDQYRKEVAVKLVKPGMDTEEILRRFRVERQILATLEHPHIARLIDGGMTSDHRPYLTMEYVDGLPLTAYCDRHRLSIPERLRLFQTVCKALQYAHQNLVIHRDLKPSNILVTGAGTVKLLDFGIAKLLHPEHTPFTVPVTRTELRLMTPDYASPEQVTGGAVSTASDVYALGVLLYELLTGYLPYCLHKRRTDEIVRILLEQEPEKPSTRVRRSETVPSPNGPARTVTPEDVSAARATVPERLRRRLAGDLDTIVLKAIQKEPQRRYASAEALAEDLQRYLSGLPVLARPETTSYRMRKFVRRHRVGVGVAVAFTMLLVAFSVMSRLQARTVAKERDVARLERDKTEQVVGLLVDLFETSNPTLVPGGDTLRVGDFLARGEAQVLGALEDQPDVQARMKQVLGKVYTARSQFESASWLLEDALAQQQALHGPDHPATVSMFHDVARLAARTDAPEAEALLRQSLRQHRRLFGSRHAAVAQALQDLAPTVQNSEERRRLLEEALTIREAVLPPTSPELAASLNDLGAYHFGHGDLPQAVSLWQRALDILQRRHGDQHPHVLTVAQNMAAAYNRLGRFDQAEMLYRNVLSQRRMLFGDQSLPVGAVLSNLGVTLTQQGDYAEAEALFRDALSIWETIFERDHWRAMNDLRNLAVVLQQQEKYDEGVRHLGQAIAVNERLHGVYSPQVGYLRGQLGILRLHQGQLDEAHHHLQAALSLVSTRAGDLPASMLADTQLRMAHVLLEIGAHGDAEAHFRQALAYRETVDVPDHPSLAEVQCGLGAALAAQGRLGEAAELLHRAVPLYAAWGRSNQLLLARARRALARTVQESSRTALARTSGKEH